jgi:hypothetical protein
MFAFNWMINCTKLGILSSFDSVFCLQLLRLHSESRFAHAMTGPAFTLGNILKPVCAFTIDFLLVQWFDNVSTFNLSLLGFEVFMVLCTLFRLYPHDCTETYTSLICTLSTHNSVGPERSFAPEHDVLCNHLRDPSHRGAHAEGSDDPSS